MRWPSCRTIRCWGPVWFSPRCRLVNRRTRFELLSVRDSRAAALIRRLLEQNTAAEERIRELERQVHELRLSLRRVNDRAGLPRNALD